MRTIVTTGLLLLPSLGSQAQTAGNKLSGTLGRLLTSTNASTVFGVEQTGTRLKAALAKGLFSVVAREEAKIR